MVSQIWTIGSRGLSLTDMTEAIRAPRLICTLLEGLGDVLHALQSERGCAALFLGSYGAMFRDRLEDQFSVSDAQVLKLRNILDSESLKTHLSSKMTVKLQGLMTRLQNLQEERGHIHAQNLKYNQIINRYTFYYNILIADLMTELALNEPGFNNDHVAAYNRLLQWKERMGRERAIGSRGFAAHAFDNPEFCDRMYGLLAEQNSFLQTLLSAANEEQRKILDELCQSDDFLRIEEIHSLIEEESRSEELNLVSAEEWFELLTRMIDRLHNVEKEFLETLWNSETGESVPDEKPQTNVSPGVNQGYKIFLKSLPVFSQLSDSDINALLAQARIREYEKGRLLFLQGEPSARFYVIVRGWVKLYNGSEGGEETILQMLSAGDTMLESAVILNMPTPMNAQVVEEATILSVPAPVIRQNLKDNNRFAVNMLANMSLRSQRLIHQIEQSRLHTAKERVGWFLLQAHLDSGGEGGVVHFPYDKALVASYLDMRPETLSRTLKKFKAEGFDINHESIRLPEPNSLCEFCDADLESQCPRAESSDCPHSGSLSAAGE